MNNPSPRPAVILVVEDEPLIRFHVVDMIESAGFEVIEAPNADAAMRILAEREDIRVLVTDINMPGSMDGVRLARAARDRWPPLEIIVMSGNVVPGDQDMPSRGVFFSKPLDERKFVNVLSGFSGA
jgi:CheY-like chemotaxis protein